MLEVEFTKVSSKGQVVIPLDMREQLGLVEGSPLAVMAQKDSILLKKIELPKAKSWSEATKPFKEAAKKLNLLEKEVELLRKEAK